MHEHMELEMLIKLEWAGPNDTCPICGWSKEHGHSKSFCPLYETLKEAAVTPSDAQRFRWLADNWRTFRLSDLSGLFPTAGDLTSYIDACLARENREAHKASEGYHE